jgi:hypothetical protein
MLRDTVCYAACAVALVRDNDYINKRKSIRTAVLNNTEIQ